MHPPNRRRAIASLLAGVCAACQFDTSPIPFTEELAQPAPSSDSASARPEAPPDFGAPANAGHAPAMGSGAAGMAAPATPPSTEPAMPAEAAMPPLDAAVPVPDAEPEPTPPAEMPDASAQDGGDAARPAPEPGAVFSACMVSTDCDEGLICTAFMAWTGGATTGYCAPYCGPGGVAADACPQPSSGLVRASCTGSLCLLESCERLQCPEGMRCVNTMTPIAPGQVIDTFACQP